MTQSRHRAAQTSVADTPADIDSTGARWKGAAPHGMWWVAWRQHRMQVLVSLGFVAAFAAAMIIFRVVLVAKFTAAGCSLTDPGPCDQRPGAGDLWSNTFTTPSELIHLTMLLAPVAMAVLVAAPIFPREFAYGNHVFALTQSVGRMRWWAVKCVVMVVPLVVGLLVLGLLIGWMDAAVGITAHQAQDTVNFVVRSIIPAAHGLLVFGIAVAAGVITRSTVAALVSALIVSGVAVAALMIAQPHVLPHERGSQPIEAAYSDHYQRPGGNDPDVRWLGGGYLDAQGNVLDVGISSCFNVATEAADQAVGVPDDQDSGGAISGSGGAVATMSPQQQEMVNSPQYQEAYDAAMIACEHRLGIVSNYTDYLPGSMVWPLRWAMTGICVILAGLFLTLAAWRLRWAVAKR